LYGIIEGQLGVAAARVTISDIEISEEKKEATDTEAKDIYVEETEFKSLLILLSTVLLSLLFPFTLFNNSSV
jgi:hypothetical protein